MLKRRLSIDSGGIRMNCPRCGREVGEGKKFCPGCGGKLDDGLFGRRQPVQAPAATDARLDRDKFLFNQKVLTLRPIYYVFDENQNRLFFIKRTLFALKRHVYIYTDQAFRDLAYTLRQDFIIGFLVRWFSLIDAQGKILARFRRRNLISILRRTWDIFDAEGNLIGQAIEDSWGKALFRRFGPLGEYFKTDFIITRGGVCVGKFIRRWTLADKYVLDMSDDPQRTFDRRTALALGVLLDTAEGR